MTRWNIEHDQGDNWVVYIDEDQASEIYNHCSDRFEDEVEGGRIGIDDNILSVEDLLFIRRRLLLLGDHNEATRQMLRALNPFYLQEMIKTGQIRDFFVKYVRKNIKEFADLAWKDRYQVLGRLETEFYYSDPDLSEKDKEDIKQIEASIGCMLSEPEVVYYFHSLIEEMNEVNFGIESDKKVVAYGCIRCEELFSVNFLYGNKPKISPCCGDSVLTELTVEDLAIMINSDQHDEHTKRKLKAMMP